MGEYFESMKEFCMEKVCEVFPTEAFREDNHERIGVAREEIADYVDYMYLKILEEFLDRAVIKEGSSGDTVGRRPPSG